MVGPKMITVDRSAYRSMGLELTKLRKDLESVIGHWRPHFACIQEGDICVNEQSRLEKQTLEAIYNILAAESKEESWLKGKR